MICQTLKNTRRSWYSVCGKNRKVDNRETHMIFIGYANNNARDCYCMYNPNTRNVTEMWLHHMYCCKPEAKDKVKVYPQVAIFFKHEDLEAREGVMLISHTGVQSGCAKPATNNCQRYGRDIPHTGVQSGCIAKASGKPRNRVPMNPS